VYPFFKLKVKLDL